jgi:hypothetical protein
MAVSVNTTGTGCGAITREPEPAFFMMCRQKKDLPKEVFFITPRYAALPDQQL